MPEVHVFMAAGKTDEQKEYMMSDITHALVENLDCAADSVTVQIVEAAGRCVVLTYVSTGRLRSQRRFAVREGPGSRSRSRRR
ncbi:tautomerase family protein [Streptomyces europaeiscabiei]|uniref:tautomerase family protein n=1 Tax=Streptomyces europaeiscabiei TaxID=146819 RepID=UPI0038F703C9